MININDHPVWFHHVISIHLHSCYYFSQLVQIDVSDLFFLNEGLSLSHKNLTWPQTQPTKHGRKGFPHSPASLQTHFVCDATTQPLDFLQCCSRMMLNVNTVGHITAGSQRDEKSQSSQVLCKSATCNVGDVHTAGLNAQFGCFCMTVHIMI